MVKNHFLMTVLVMTFVMAGCKDRNRPAESSSNTTSTPLSTPTSAAPASSSITDKWLGKWIGPEGTFLVLSKNGDRYVVEIHSLDGPATYEGTPAGDRIEFQRNGTPESIHAGSGQQTGMKWLLDKKNCLIIRTGEGFCKD